MPLKNPENIIGKVRPRMHGRFQQMLSDLGLRLLEKSRSYYYPPTWHSELIEEDLSDAEYAVLLAEIDQFSAQFLVADSK